MASPSSSSKRRMGKLWPVQDYRKLNEMTIKNRYPLPLISELMDKLQGTKYFSKLGCSMGLQQCTHQDWWWVESSVQNQLRLVWANSYVLQAYQLSCHLSMDDEWHLQRPHCIWSVTVYLDDILIMSKTKEEHRCITRKVLKVLWKNKLFLKAEKCEFETLETEYLRVIISKGSIHMDPVKIAGIAEWPVPAKKQQLQSFLGFTNFYRCFIKGYSKVVKPMMQLTGNDPWKWGPAQQGAFEELKKAVGRRGGTSNTNGGRQISHWSRCQWRSNRGGFYPKEQDGKWPPSRISIQVPHGYRTKLQNLR